LLAALGDASPLVRRRAVLLLGFSRGSGAEEALRASLSDRDGGVARAAALALSGRPTATAQAALARALDHGEESVRRIASTSVARWSGESVAAAAPAEDRRRAARRIAEKLSAVGATALRDAVVLADPMADPAPARPAIARVVAPARVAPALAQPAVSPSVAASVAASVAPRAAAPAQKPRASVAVVEAPSGAPSPLEEAVLLELRSALRGRTPDEISRVVPGGADRALAALVARGAAIQRGARYFPA
jgi:hypothetical protein